MHVGQRRGLASQKALSILALVSIVVCLFVLCGEQTAYAQRFRNEDHTLLSEKYQKRVIQSVRVNEDQREAMKLWQSEINRILEMSKAKRPSEKDLHEQFFTDVFVKALGFKKKTAGTELWTIKSEDRTDVDSTRPDGVLGHFNAENGDKNVQVVIELKGPGVDLDLRQNRKQDRRTPVDQAFSYAHKYDDVQWVIVSNYGEVRLYNKRSSKYAIHFNLSTLPDNENHLKLFLLLLSKDNILAKDGKSTSSALYAERDEELKQITNRFYKDYKEVRLATADNILKNNDTITIDIAVQYAQTILDRILFTAFLEDLHLIPAETIEKAYITNNPYSPATIWENFKGLFKALDTGSDELSIPEYNGGLFRSHPEILALKLTDDVFAGYKTLADYDFLSDLRVNILGHVFEQSITDTEVLKARLRGEDNEDTRRHDEGAYYTPDSITAYIVDKTLGTYLEDIRVELGLHELPEITNDKWLRDKKNKTRAKHIGFWEAYTAKIQSIKIVDPSCGSGAFLVAAFDYLEAEGERINKELDRLYAPRLFTHWDKDILKNNLYGVDLSPEAAEITRLSLWLKIAQNKEKLVALDHNIRAGNAVVNDKAYAGSLAFNWQQAFPEILNNGGFDIVLGNPPYVRHELIKDIKPALESRFDTYAGTADLFVYFYELGFSLLKENGYLGYISSNKWMRAQYGEAMRALIADKTTIISLIDLGEEDLFEGATTYTNMLVFKKQTPAKKSRFIMSEPPFGEEYQELDQARLSQDSFQVENPVFYTIKDKMEKKGMPLAKWDIDIYRGVTTGFNDAFYISTATKEALIKQDPKSADIIKPALRGRNMHKWYASWQDEWLIFTRRGIDIEQYPAIKQHLLQFYERLKPKQKGDKIGRKAGPYQWYEIQDSTSYYRAFDKEKIVWPRITHDSQFSIDTVGYYPDSTIHLIVGDNIHYLTALLNSDLAFWYLKARGSNLRGGYAELVDWLVKLFPAPHISKADQEPFIVLSKDLHSLATQRADITGHLIKLAESDLGLKKISQKMADWPALNFKGFLKELSKQKIKPMGRDKEDWLERFERLQKTVISLDNTITDKQSQLNTLVHELYGLTEEEINFYKKSDALRK